MSNHNSLMTGLALLTFCLFALQMPGMASAAGRVPVAGAGWDMPAPPGHRSMRSGSVEKLAFKIIQKKWEKRLRENQVKERDFVNNKTDERQYNAASLVLGIFSVLSALFAWTGYAFVLALLLALVLGILGLYRGITGLKRGYPKKGMAVAGVILSGAGLALTVLTAVLIIYLI